MIFIMKDSLKGKKKRAKRYMCFATIGTDIFPGTLREVLLKIISRSID